MTTSLSDEELLGRETTPIPPAAPGAPYDVVFLDRDGTLNVHRPGYVDDPADLVLLPGAAGAVRACNDAGCRVVLVTNQRGIATGVLRTGALLTVHRALVERLAAVGARLDAVQVCPHDEGVCDCRKPLPGLLHQAFRRAHWADPGRCVLLGDQDSDLAAGRAASVPSVNVSAQGGLATAVDLLLGSSCSASPVT